MSVEGYVERNLALDSAFCSFQDTENVAGEIGKWELLTSLGSGLEPPVLVLEVEVPHLA